MLDYRERVRISAEEQLKRPAEMKKPWWGRVSYPYVISTLALLVSATSFYFTNLDTRRDLLMFSQTVGSGDIGVYGALHFHLIFKNVGEEVEVVEAVSLMRMMPNPTFARGENGQSLWHSTAPVILKGGEATAVAMDYSPADDRSVTPGEVSSDKCGGPDVLLIDMTVVGTNGNVTTLNLPIADICAVGSAIALDNLRGLDRAPVHLLADSTAATYPPLAGFPGCNDANAALPICQISNRSPPPPRP